MSNESASVEHHASERAAIRRPVQVYLAEEEAALLERAALAWGTTKSDVMRRALRRLALDLVPPEADPAWHLIGAAGDDADLPDDLAARHDEYLISWEAPSSRPFANW